MIIINSDNRHQTPSGSCSVNGEVQILIKCKNTYKGIHVLIEIHNKSI